MPQRIVNFEGRQQAFPADATDQEISAALKAIPAANAETMPKAATWTDWAVDALPTVGGAVGGIIGGIGGTVAGMGVGGVPGAVGGAAVGGMGGEAARRNINMLRGRPADTPEDAALGIVKQGAIQGGSQAVGAGIGAGMKAVAPALMQSAVKPGIALLKEYKTTAPKLVQTLLDEGVNVSAGGIQKLNRLLTSTNDEIADLIANATGRVPKSRVAAQVAPVAQRVSQQTNPTRDLAKIGDTVTEFLDHPVYKGDLTIPEAQAMKRGTYRQIGKKYGEMGASEVEAQKALARGLKEEVADAVPEVSALNAQDSRLMAALDAVGRRVAVAGNRDPVGFAWAASHNPTAFVAALLDRSPAVKSMLARGLWSSASKVTGVAPHVIRTAVAGVVNGKDEDEK